MNAKLLMTSAALVMGACAPLAAQAQTTYAEDFTKSSTANSWYYFSGACLTAGSTPGVTGGSTAAGQIPACYNLPYYTALGDNTTTSGKGGTTGTLPDTAGSGALRFTNNFGYERGAIVSGFAPFATNLGLQVTFTTETYEGNSYNNASNNKDGADGISFFLQSADDPLNTPGVGATGGSLGYTCSNTNAVNDGLIGGYLGVGIDEFGNFLNQSDNTSSGQGIGQVGNRIGMRGPGSTTWIYLNNYYPSYYPTYLTATQRLAAVKAACVGGVVQNWALGSALPVVPAIALTNYPYIFGKTLPSGTLIANESAIYRGNGSAAQTGTKYGVPITYSLLITSGGLLSLSYSYNGGVYLPVITNQNIATSFGALPKNVRFGFAGSTGGGTNIHEIMCFKAAPTDTAQSSVGVQKQSAKVQVGTQVYFAYYNPSTWAGSLTSENLADDGTGNLVIGTTNWDAACVLTGVTTCVATGVAGPTSGQGYTTPGRVMLTWNDSLATPIGIPFEWSNLSAAQVLALTDAADDPTGKIGVPSSYRLNYLRGQQTYEAPASGAVPAMPYRPRTSLLGDIVDSSPTWVGPPSSSYAGRWVDKLNGAIMPENSAAVPYATFATNYASRLNVVYAGANDGFMHGFEAGSYSASGVYNTAQNDGREVVAYMPSAVVKTIHQPDATDAQDDFSNPLYGHDFNVDGTPTTGDMFYGGAWHTVLVGGLGPGGSAIFALDITDPSLFKESNASSLVLGEWTPASLTCANTALPAVSCGTSLGNTYGVPSIRRFHNGQWGFVFGNGLGSSSGDAGVFVMLKNPSSTGFTTYYLSTGTAGTSNGITYATPSDLDGDQVTDYIYAGDILGNIWRFDVTSSSAANWSAKNATNPALAVKPIFTTAAGQPITTKVIVLGAAAAPSTHVLVEFGTGQVTALTSTQPATYSTGTQALYGIWDWNMSDWNRQSTTTFATLYNSTSVIDPIPSGGKAQPTAAISTSAAPKSNAQATLLTQTILTQVAVSSTTETAAGFRTLSNNPICYADASGCTQFGWYLILAPPPPATSSVAEQLIYSPLVSNGAFIVNTTVPPTNNPTACQSTLATGWTMALNPGNGGGFASSVFADVNGNFVTTAGQTVSGVQLNGTGTPAIVTYVYNGVTEQFLITQTTTAGITSGTATTPTGYVAPTTTPPTPQITKVNLPGGAQGSRLTWIEKR